MLQVYRQWSAANKERLETMERIKWLEDRVKAIATHEHKARYSMIRKFMSQCRPGNRDTCVIAPDGTKLLVQLRAREHYYDPSRKTAWFHWPVCQMFEDPNYATVTNWKNFQFTVDLNRKKLDEITAKLLLVSMHQLPEKWTLSFGKDHETVHDPKHHYDGYVNMYMENNLMTVIQDFYKKQEHIAQTLDGVGLVQGVVQMVMSFVYRL